MEENEKKDSIIFYKSFYTAIKKLPKKYQLSIYQAIFEKYFFRKQFSTSRNSERNLWYDYT